MFVFFTGDIAVFRSKKAPEQDISKLSFVRSVNPLRWRLRRSILRQNIFCAGKTVPNDFKNELSPLFQNPRLDCLSDKPILRGFKIGHFVLTHNMWQNSSSMVHLIRLKTTPAGNVRWKERRIERPSTRHRWSSCCFHFAIDASFIDAPALSLSLTHTPSSLL